MQDLKLGQIITEPRERDAIHIAVMPVEAAEGLSSGNPVWIGPDGRAKSHYYSRDPEKPAVGIVDPFLPGNVSEGQKFWLFLYPNTITSLRHDWRHPVIDHIVPPPPDDPVEASRKWITAFAAQLDLTYGRLMDAARMYNNYGDWTRDNSERYKDHWQQFPTFWKHYEIVTGETAKDYDDVPFTCSC